MDFFIIWLLVLCADLMMWTIWSRCYRLRKCLDRILVIRRTTRKESGSSRPLLSMAGLVGGWVFRPVKTRLLSLYLEDDKNMTGFNPARTLRALIVICIVAQNVAAMVVVRDNGVREAFSRSGKLACANMLPLALLAFPDLGIARLVRQPSPQVVWAHTPFGWIIWYEVLFHAVLSIFYLSSPQIISLLAGGVIAGIFLYVALFHATQNRDLKRGPYRYSTRRRWSIVHLSLTFICMIGLIIHVWPSSPLVATIVIVLVIQIAGMPAGSFSMSMDRRAMSNEIKDKTSEYPQSDKTYTIPDQDKIAEGILNGTDEQTHIHALKIPKYRLLKIKVYPAENGGEDYYFKVNGVPVRIAWLERGKKGQYKAALIVNEMIIGQEGFEMSDLYIEGPCVIPPSPYTFGPRDLNILATDSGILEAYSCLRWRLSITEIKFTTYITWFSDDSNLINLLTKDYIGKRPKMTIVWYGKRPMPDETHKALRHNESIRHLETEKNIRLEDILSSFIMPDRHQYVIDESLRAFEGSIIPLKNDKRPTILGQCCEATVYRTESLYSAATMVESEDEPEIHPSLPVVA